MKMHVWLALAALVVSGCYCQPRPNGHQGTLQFDSAPGAQPWGAESRIVIPEHIFLSGKSGKLDLNIPYDAQLDFKDTTLETDSAPGLEVKDVTQQENRDYVIRMLCKTESSEPAKLGVKIKSGKSVRYEDEIFFFCFRNWAAFSDRDGETWATDARFGVLLSQREFPDAGMFLSTHYLRVPPGGFELYPDGGAPENIYNGVRHPVRTVHAAQALAFESGEMSASVPIRVVEDSQWRMILEVVDVEPALSGNGISVRLQGRGAAAGVEEVRGVENCEFDAKEQLGSRGTAGASADCRGRVQVEDKPWRACMRFRANVGCLLLHPDGGSEIADGGS